MHAALHMYEDVVDIFQHLKVHHMEVAKNTEKCAITFFKAEDDPTKIGPFLRAFRPQ